MIQFFNINLLLTQNLLGLLNLSFMKGISMKYSKITSPVSPDNTNDSSKDNTKNNSKTNTNNNSKDSSKLKKRKTNWHEAAVCAIQIELRDYAKLLEFRSEFVLGRNSYRIDFLIIKKLTEQPLHKNFAQNFQFYNLFEIKGIGSSIKISSYYKTVGYAGLLIDQLSTDRQYTALNITITFLSFHYPNKLIRHLVNERNLTVSKSAPGIYHINDEIFFIQIIVTKELNNKDNMHMHCLTDKLKDADLINRLIDDFKKHSDEEIYIKYMNQIANANIKLKGDSPMVCEGILNLCGTSSEEIIARTKKEQEEFYLPRINELSNSNQRLISTNEQLTSSNEQLTSSNQQLSDQIDYLKNLLKQNNIPFNLESAIKP